MEPLTDEEDRSRSAEVGSYKEGEESESYRVRVTRAVLLGVLLALAVLPLTARPVDVGASHSSGTSAPHGTSDPILTYGGSYNVFFTIQQDCLGFPFQTTRFHHHVWSDPIFGVWDVICLVQTTCFDV